MSSYCINIFVLCFSHERTSFLYGSSNFTRSSKGKILQENKVVEVRSNSLKSFKMQNVSSIGIATVYGIAKELDTTEQRSMHTHIGVTSGGCGAVTSSGLETHFSSY